MSEQWKVEENTPGSSYILVMNENEVVAKVNRLYDNRALTEQRAALIASAPQMREALEQIIKDIDMIAFCATDCEDFRYQKIITAEMEVLSKKLRASLSGVDFGAG